MASTLSPQQVAQALDGDRRAMQAMVKRILSAVQVEVGYALLREAHGEGRDPRQEIRDFVQEVFVSLLADRGRVLRSWDPERGRSFDNFVRLIARRHVAATLRSIRRNPWTDKPVPGDELERLAIEARSPAALLETSDGLAWLLERLGARLDERGWRLFAMLFVEERSVEEVMDAVDMTRDAVYAWRLRLRKLAHSIAQSQTRQSSTTTPGLSPLCQPTAAIARPG